MSKFQNLSVLCARMRCDLSVTCSGIHYGDGRTGQHRTSTVSDRTMDTLWAHMSDALALTRHRVCQRGYRVLLR